MEMSHTDQSDADHRKAQLEKKVRYRVSCEAKAFDIVNRLLETSITEEYLKEACQFISRSHYDDVVEERAIAHLCGYPLCSNTLNNVPKKKYHISTKSNRVYDITERKNFCSNQCYKASKYLQKQVPDTPVWSRENEPRINYDLLSTAGSKGEVGEEVVGPNLFSLKEDLQSLEELDRRTQPPKDAAARKKQIRESAPNPEKETEPVPVSAHAVEGEASGLSEKMKQLSFDKEKIVQPVVKASREECLNHPAEVQAETEETALEHKLKSLTFTESKEQADVDSDDDAGVSVGATSGQILTAGDVLAEYDSVVGEDSKPHFYPAATGNESPIDRRQSAMSNVASVGEVQEKSVDALESRISSVETVEPASETVTQIQGESKAAYLMRLLDRKKQLLSKMADIQPTAVHSESEQTDERRTSQPAADSERRTNPSWKQNQSSAVTSQHKVRPSLTQAKTSDEPASQSKASPLEAVCQIVQQWVTTETLTYLGVKPSGEGGQSDIPSTFHSDPEMQRKYQNLCQKLAGQEKDFEDVLGEEEVEDRQEGEMRKPVPHFDELAKQTAEFQLKVTEFMRGPGSQKKRHVKPGDEGDGVGCGGDEEPKQERPIVLPVVDSHNQQLIRRRIVLDRLNHSISALLPPLGLGVQDVSSILRELVFTFSFTSQNIVFKPAEWSLVSFILLKMLAYKSSEVSIVFGSKTKGKTLDIVLQRLGHSSESLSQLVDRMLTEQMAVS